MLLAELPGQVERVLDLGCGDGRMLDLVLAACPGATGVALDMSPPMLEVVRARIAGDEHSTRPRRTHRASGRAEVVL